MPDPGGGFHIAAPPMNLPGTDLLNKSALSEAVTTLFNENKIGMISDLNDDEIKLITRIYIIAKIKGITIWEDGVKRYMELVLSRKRKSRAEILDAIGRLDKKLNILERALNFGRGDQNKS